MKKTYIVIAFLLLLLGEAYYFFVLLHEYHTELLSLIEEVQKNEAEILTRLDQLQQKTHKRAQALTYKELIGNGAYIVIMVVSLNYSYTKDGNFYFGWFG
jgi:hypothetical protein|uniref:Uncharacterized protein n=1 Tax=Microchloropsis salina TaxID=2511165 RepID=A0A023PKG8_9STRA|nr:hypothetical protein NskMp00206 [Microchloropsis salina]